MRYVIVGGGIAGTTAAEELRKRAPHSEITLVSEEFSPLYSRVLLPHYIKDKIPRERVFLKKETWYPEQGIEWLRGVRTQEVDVRNKHIALSDGRELPYDMLLLATGGELRTLGADVRGVSYLRTLEDADHLKQLLGGMSAQAHAGIYGGGFIACEYINIFAHAGIRTSVVLRGPHFWSQVLEPQAGALLTAHLERGGVEVCPNEMFKQVSGEKTLTGFTTSVREHPCDILGVGIGIAPDDGWIRNGGITTDDGIVCDAFLQTNVPDVFAVGDAVRFYDAGIGRHVRVGNWMNAQMQGRVVAKTMTGEKTAFALVSSYATNALGLEIIFIGDTDRAHADDVRLQGSTSEGGISQLFIANNRLIGAVLLNRNKERPELTRQIQEKRPI